MSTEMIENGRYLSKYSNGEYPDFFFGKIGKDDKGNFRVEETLSRGRWRGKSIDLINDPVSVERNVNTWVVGCARKNREPKLFIDNELEAPVEIIPWNYIEQSEGGKIDAIMYFMEHGESLGKPLTCETIPLIGGDKNKGHIVICTSVKGQDGVDRDIFLKGFLSVGYSCIEYSNVHIWNGGEKEEGFQLIAGCNQTISLEYKDQCFLMVVPKRNNEFKDNQSHSVLDFSAKSGTDECGWKVLPTLSQQTDGNGPKQTKNSNNDSSAEFRPSVGGVIADAIERQAAKGGKNAEETAETHSNTAHHNVPAQKSIITEEEFLKRFIEFVEKCGYKYNTRDLIRFHTCVKCGFFTLLGGEPGTGKSSLAQLYAKAIAGKAYKDREQLLRVDVNPGWMEPADLMGYYSASADGFLESEVGLVSFLEKAKEAAGLGMVCFEEMNLAYVEHYFSDFIQQMSRANGDRAVVIKKQRKGCESISLNDNLRFFGTINFDETTKELSARFYDRCNYIELSPTGEAFPRLSGPVKNDILCKGDEISSKVFNEWVDNAWEVKIGEGIRSWLDEVYPILQSLHIAPNWRKARDIYRYIASRPRFLDEESRDDYEEIEIKKGENVSKIRVSKFDLNVLDEVMVQSILPVYRRPNEFREKPQRELWEFLKNKKLNLSKDMFERILGIETPYQDET